MDRVARAANKARGIAHASRQVHAPTAGDERGRAVRVAVGDPQAPLETVLAVLDAHGLLSDDGTIRADVALYSMGDHFDWGGAAEAERAGADGLALLAWLASHPVDQVHLVLGNHDLARVGELAGFDDATFREARALAVRAYTDGDEAREHELLARFPALPTAETAARDFASFTVAQRELVTLLLRARRFRIAFATASDVVLTHAGITASDVAPLGAPSDAPGIARALNGRLDEALARWTGGPLAIPALHSYGSAARGEGGGIFYHRPTSRPIPVSSREHSALGRRFDPRTIPRGVTQVIGHIGDEKCRDLMPEWSHGAAEDGVLRTFVTDGVHARYARGASACEGGPDCARILFTDGTMRRARIGAKSGDAGAYEILDLDTMTPFVPR